MGQILVVEFNEKDYVVFDEIKNILKRHTDFEFLQIEYEPLVLLAGVGSSNY